MKEPEKPNILSSDDADYIWSLMPDWVRRQPEGLGPEMYGTLNRGSDTVLAGKVKKILFGK